MILKYKDYIGLCIYMQRIGDEGGEYRIILEDCSNIKTKINITCNIQEIEILDCIGNSYLTDKFLQEGRENKLKDLKIIEPDSMKFNVARKEIIMNTNLGELKMSYAEAFEIMWTLLDATVGISENTQCLLEKIDSEYCLDKF